VSHATTSLTPTVIVAVHVNGNATVNVIDAVDAQLVGRGADDAVMLSLQKLDV